MKIFSRLTGKNGIFSPREKPCPPSSELEASRHGKKRNAPPLMPGRTSSSGRVNDATTSQSDRAVRHGYDPAELDALIQRLGGDEPGRNRHKPPPKAETSTALPAGLSELDDVPSAALASKPAFVKLTAAHATEHGPAPSGRLHHFQGHELSSSGVDLGANLSLGVALGVGGAAALHSGVADIRQARADKKSLAIKKSELESKKHAFQDHLNASTPGLGPEAATPETPFLKREIAVLDAELERLDHQLHLTRGHRDVGAGSAAAGLISVIRAGVDLAVKPLAYVRPETVEVTGTLLSSVAVGLSPLGAVAGLGMGVRAKMVSHSQRIDFKQKMRAAMDELGVCEEKLPPDLRAHYRRCFVDGKWHSRDLQGQSFDRLLAYFVSGMGGYTATVSGLSMVKLLVVGAIAADVTLSTAVLTSAMVVLVGVYGFMKHHSREHRYAKWTDSTDVGMDRDFLLSLAASGHLDGLIQPLTLSMLVDRKRARRDDFLYALAVQAGLRPVATAIHSTDSEAVRTQRQEQKKALGNHAGQRFLAAHHITSQNVQSLAKAAGVFVGSAVRRGPREAKEAAQQSHLAHTDLLSTRTLPGLLEMGRNHALLVAYMLEDVQDDIGYLEGQIQKKVQLYGADSVPARTDSAARPNGVLLEHLSAVGQRLILDKDRLRDMQELRDRLQRWKRSPAADAQEMNVLQARFLAVQQRLVFDHLEIGRDALSSHLAHELLRHGKERDRATLGRLHLLTLDAAPLRRRAASQLPIIDTHVPAWDRYVGEYLGADDGSVRGRT